MGRAGACTPNDGGYPGSTSTSGRNRRSCGFDGLEKDSQIRFSTNKWTPNALLTHAGVSCAPPPENRLGALSRVWRICSPAARAEGPQPSGPSCAPEARPKQCQRWCMGPKPRTPGLLDLLSSPVWVGVLKRPHINVRPSCVGLNDRMFGFPGTEQKHVAHI